MWPAPRAPISTTSASVSPAAFTRVSGTPSSLLKEPMLDDVRQRAPRATASRSLTLVLPTEPVMPTTRPGRRVRAWRPTAPSASTVSSTSTAVASTPSTDHAT